MKTTKYIIVVLAICSLVILSSIESCKKYTSEDSENRVTAVTKLELLTTGSWVMRSMEIVYPGRTGSIDMYANMDDCEKDDIVIGISGSGNSRNILNAIKFANEMKAHTIVLTGMDGGKISKISKISLTVPSNDMLTIETLHLLICHLLITMIRQQGKPLFTY